MSPAARLYPATSPIILSPAQLTLIARPLDAKIFLEGPAGSGKTTVGVERMLYLMAQGVPGDTILLMVPQRTLAAPYYEALQHPGVVAGGMVSVVTMGGLARRMIDLFWPEIVETAGFARPDEPPVFLTLETAQYYMAHLVRPLLDEDFFDSVTIDRNRLYSQILDNLNKAAVVGFPHTEIGERLKVVKIGDPAQARIYQDAQECAIRFRQYCLAHNLLDFSLQVEVFMQHLSECTGCTQPHHSAASALCQEYLVRTYRHLLVDDLEEDTPVAHDLLRAWLPQFESALLIYDQDAGYRRFLGADPQTGYALKDLCEEQYVFNTSFVTSEGTSLLGQSLSGAIRCSGGLCPPLPASSFPSRRMGQEDEVCQAKLGLAALSFQFHRFHPQMLDWVADQIDILVHNEDIPPSEIVVLAPYLSDALRFSLANRLASRQIPARSHRPSRSLRDEPATLCLLTLAKLAHPEWGFTPAKFDVAYALVQAIQDMDLVRAQLLVEAVYSAVPCRRIREGIPSLSSFDLIKADMRERITYRLGERYEGLRAWLLRYREVYQDEFDHFLSRLFGEVLSQPGYGFHASRAFTESPYSAGEVAANLIESVQKFRWSAGRTLAEEGIPLGKEYLAMVQDGVIAAQYIRSWQVQPDEAVQLMPAYTFLMSNRPVEVQFWLDAGSRGWTERLYQPLTHPYVLSRSWPRDKLWTDYEEVMNSQDALNRLTLGLTRRCRRKIYLGLSEFSEQGYEERGPLLRAFQRVLQQ